MPRRFEFVGGSSAKFWEVCIVCCDVTVRYSEHDAVKRELSACLPKVDLPPAPGSKSRVLTYDAKTVAVTWEGAAVRPNDPIPELEK